MPSKTQISDALWIKMVEEGRVIPPSLLRAAVAYIEHGVWSDQLWVLT